MNIIELAKELGFRSHGKFSEIFLKHRIKRFAAIVRAEALEEAAKVCEQDEFQIYKVAERCAAAIRGIK